MKDGNMTIAHIGKGKDTLMQVPPAPKHLSTEGKKGYKFMGDLLAKQERLKNHHLPVLEIFAEAYAQWVWACNAIIRKNKTAFGSGYIQVFKTGATNITTEMSVRNDAADTMLKCSKQFGLDPRSEKELKAVVENNQLSWADDFFNESNAQ